MGQMVAFVSQSAVRRRLARWRAFSAVSREKRERADWYRFTSFFEPLGGEKAPRAANSPEVNPREPWLKG